jgi:hypothetical protein
MQTSKPFHFKLKPLKKKEVTEVIEESNEKTQVPLSPPPIDISHNEDVDEIEKFAKLGQVQIALRKLHYCNRLSVKTKEGKYIHYFPTLTVSDNFASLVFDMCQHSKILDQRDVLILVEPERELMDIFLFVAKLHKIHFNSLDETRKRLKETYKNLTEKYDDCTNEETSEIIENIKHVLRRLVLVEMISSSTMKKYLKEM